MTTLALPDAGAEALYRPPAPVPTSPVRALLRALVRGERDLLSLVPREAYTEPLLALAARRGVLYVNEPALVHRIMLDAEEIFPKNDLMVGALQPLVGDSIFVSSGERWRHQRRMIDPAFSHMRVHRSYPAMVAAVDDHEAWLDAQAASGAPLSLDAAMASVTADVICRTIFSQTLAGGTAREVFHAFVEFERHVSNVDLVQLLVGKPWAEVPQPPRVLEACRLIRQRVDELLAPRLAMGDDQLDDIVGATITARDPETGEGFTREELIDQIGVFFLAGHETTASVLTWCAFIMSQRPSLVTRMRAEVDALCGDGPVEFEHAKRLAFVRNVFRETMRLYPPITFIPRVAARDTEIGGRAVRRGTMVMIAPWTIHRHERIWANPDRFDPDRWAPEREQQVPPGAYIPFGIGPRICVGAAFATLEATMILARFVRRYDVEALDPAAVRPIARLTTRPATEIRVRVHRRRD
ncbi:MAG: cytochrome P450 [Gemmatimonadaceae bacterium]|nr:cytochrome P450 [Gemmatimonadaceae bacterium]